MTDSFATASTARLLVVEDDDTIRDTVCEALEMEGFTVLAATNGQSAWDRLKRETFELVVLDVMLPGINGLDLCRKLRELDQQPLVLMVSARDTETDRVLGLEVGADDYLIKPFGIRELVARCRALLRRHQPTTATAARLDFEDLQLFPKECRACREGIELKLSPKEFKLLELFMQHPKRVWSREQLIEQIWGVDYIGDSKTVDVHIRWLREKIEANPSEPTKLVTVRGFGYRFG
ncbi:MAG: response regulator transcription factor [Vulcanococcus sp.]